MSSDSTIWYRVGYALEKARGRTQSSDEGVRARDSGAVDTERVDWPTVDDLIASGVVALAGKILDAWRPTRKATFTRLLRAGAAGAGAALLLDLVRPLLRGQAELPTIDEDTGARMLAGASQGLLYAAVVEPRVPGPPLLKGAVFALAEYMAYPAGGLTRLLGSRAPQGRLPVVADLLGDLEADDREYLEHFAFGVALAILYGTAPSAESVEEVGQED